MFRSMFAFIFCLTSTTVVLAQEPLSAEEAGLIRRQFFTAYEKHDDDKALELGLKHDQFDSRDALVSFNMARIFGRKGDKEKSLAWFKKASETGFMDARAAFIDPDLKLIQQEPGFKQAVESVMRLRELSDMEPESYKVWPKPPLITLPPRLDPEKPAPLIVLVHPMIGGPERISGAWKEAAATLGAIIVAPYAGYALNPDVADWGLVKDAEEIVFSAIAAVKRAHDIDEARIILGGFSYGGNYALCVGMRNPAKFRGIVLYAARYDPWLARPPKDAPATSLPRVHLGVGSIDVAAPDNEQAARDYRYAGIPVKHVVYPDLGHEYPKETTKEIEKAIRWTLSNEP